jgi:hypothetical protein
MKASRARFWWIVGILLLLCLATLIKRVLNSIDEDLHDFYDGPVTQSVEDARKKGRLAATFEINPKKFEAMGKVYEIEEAWLEAAYRPSYWLVWFPDDQRRSFNYLCVRTKEPPRESPFAIYLSARHAKELYIPEPTGIGGTGFRGHDPYYQQRVPLDLNELKQNVTFVRYDINKQEIVKTAQLTREEE